AGCAGAMTLLDEVVLPGSDRAREDRDRVRAEVPGAGRTRVLDGPAVDRDGRGRRGEELDEVVRVRRAAVPAAALDLADHEAGAHRVRRRRERTPEQRDHGRDGNSETRPNA